MKIRGTMRLLPLPRKKLVIVLVLSRKEYVFTSTSIERKNVFLRLELKCSWADVSCEMWASTRIVMSDSIEDSVSLDLSLEKILSIAAIAPKLCTWTVGRVTVILALRRRSNFPSSPSHPWADSNTRPISIYFDKTTFISWPVTKYIWLDVFAIMFLAGNQLYEL